MTNPLRLLFLSAVCALCSAAPASAQQTLRATDTAQRTPLSVPRRPVVPKIKPIAHEISFALRLHTDGWSLAAERGFVRSEETKFRDLFHDINFVSLELGEKRHPKEMRSSIAGDPQRTRPFVFGKVANFFAVKPGIGRRQMIAGKPESGTTSVHWVYGGGFALGLSKPYYVRALVRDVPGGPFSEQTIKYSDETAESFLNENLISGAAGFTQGLGEMSLTPGLHARTGLHFDFAPRRTTKLAIELGVSAEVYTKAIEIMANQPTRPYFANIYAAIQLGKRWP